MIHLVKTRASERQIAEMMEMLSTYIKLAVDIEREILAGGGALHADCESILLEDGSLQENIWGADWIPSQKIVTFEALINIRPKQNNMSMEIQDEGIKRKIRGITLRLLSN